MIIIVSVVSQLDANVPREWSASATTMVPASPEYITMKHISHQTDIEPHRYHGTVKRCGA
jgi:hypothetical protein